MEYTVKTLKKAPATLGYTLYQGPSVLDGAPIAAILTLKTSNRKTGNMAQVWIIRTDDNPVAISQAKLDGSICGSCPHKQSVGGACYVNIGQAPLAVYKAFKRGRYSSDLSGLADKLAGRMLRLGAYGDPSAIPYEALASVAAMAKGHTGYTHQVTHKAFDKRYLGLCMVSADTPKQALKYQKLGAHTFRVALEGDTLAEDELECLADAQGLQCADCGLCDGTKRNIAITVHGSRSKRFKSNLINLKEVA
jgi:hypothetical protein